MNEKNLFDNIELNTAENTDVSIKDVIMDDTPQITSLEWNDYVMSLFEEDELIENRPLSAGLRRVSELVLDAIELVPSLLGEINTFILASDSASPTEWLFTFSSYFLFFVALKEI